MIVGVTGGIASGKSTVLNILKAIGASTIDADQISKELTAFGGDALSEIEAVFGKEYFNSDGSLNRSELGQLIFNDAQAKNQLEQILHPRITARITQLIQNKKKNDPDNPVIVDIPLLFEINKQDEYDEIWVVWVDYQTQLKRLIDRTGLTAEQAKSRIEAQLSLDYKATLADKIIDNSQSIEETKEQVKKHYYALLK